MKKIIGALLLTTLVSACSTTSNLVKSGNPVTAPQQSYTIVHSATTPSSANEMYFYNALNQQLQKANFKQNIANSDTTIKYELDFDEGNRALRYFVGFGAGKAKAKIKVYLINKADNNTLATITTDASLSMGAFGGEAKSVLDNSAKDIVKKITEAGVFSAQTTAN